MLSWGEITVVFFIALLLFGADKIPDFARTVGKMVNEFQRIKQTLRDEMDEVKTEMDEVKSELDEVKEEADKFKEETEDEIQEITDEAYRNL